MNLFSLSFAGGSASAYRGLQDLAGEGLNVIPLELPGRGRRFSQALLLDLHEMAKDQFCLIRKQLSDEQPYALFGHSMGAWLVYLITRYAASDGVRLPECLFVSGWKGPSAVNDGRFHLLPSQAFFAMLKDLGGCPDAVLAEPELMALCEPIIRADFHAVETYRYVAEEPLDIPIVVLSGDADREVGKEDLLLWSRETTATVDYHRFPGGHFYVLDHWSAILRIITARLSAQTVMG